MGGRVRARLQRAGIKTVSALWSARPRALRAVWGSVHGERLWYALHGHDVGPLRTRRGSVGHGRVLPPEARSAASARPWVRLLVVKAARRLRREGWTAKRLSLTVERLGAPLWQGTEALGRKTRIIRLDEIPESEIEARRMARTLRNSGQIDEWGEIGHATYEDIQTGDWSVAIRRSQALADAAKTLRRDIQLRKLSQYGTAKDTGRQIRGGGWREAREGESKGLPVVKGKGAEEQGRLSASTTLYVPQETGSEKQRKRIRSMEDSAGRLLVTAGQDTRSGTVTAMVSETPAIGNGWFPVTKLDRKQAKAAAVWLNSCYGRIIIMQGAAGRKLRFPGYSVEHISELVMPDLEDDEIVQGLASVYDETAEEDVGRYDADIQTYDNDGTRQWSSMYRRRQHSRTRAWGRSWPESRASRGAGDAKGIKVRTRIPEQRFGGTGQAERGR